ncbi:MAG: type II toxin-antitoxin system ParD family antitoxin [Chitinophagales bacterium]|nr:type II toxin-antitoxin system ParD family antitoxin [Chitinophagales bacterium]
MASGKYSSVSEAVRTALRIFEEEENKTKSSEYIISNKKNNFSYSSKSFLIVL